MATSMSSTQSLEGLNNDQTSTMKSNDKDSNILDERTDDHPYTEAAEPVSELPDYVLSPDAVLKDKCAWRYGQPPDYSKTRNYWRATRQKNHEPGSLESIVENLVKNWEIEASFKTNIEEWRTIDHDQYTFSVNGGPPQSAKHMAKVGTYNAIIAANEFYSPEGQDFSASHKVFKRAMPTFAWECLEVLSGPPVVTAKWRHWGVMANDLVSFNDKDEKVTVKAHGGTVDVLGVIIARVSAALKIISIEIFHDALDLFRQMASGGIVNKQPRHGKVHDAEKEVKQYLTHQGNDAASQEHGKSIDDSARESTLKSIVGKHLSSTSQVAASESEKPNANNAKGVCPMAGMLAEAQTAGDGDDTKPAAGLWTAKAVDMPSSRQSGLWSKDDKAAVSDEHGKPTPTDWKDDHLKQSADAVHPHDKTIERAAKPAPGEAVAAPAGSQETASTRQEMSKPFSQNTPIDKKIMNSE